MLIWEREIKLIPSRHANIDQGHIEVFTTIWDQCSLTVKETIEQLPDYKMLWADKDPVALLEEVENIMCGHKRHKPRIYSMMQLIKILCIFFRVPTSAMRITRNNLSHCGRPSNGKGSA